jgi:hypothetical protein
MNIGKDINEYVYEDVWKGIWSDCRQLMTDKTRPEKQIGIYHSIAFNVNEVIGGGIVVEINKTIMVRKIGENM